MVKELTEDEALQKIERLLTEARDLANGLTPKTADLPEGQDPKEYFEREHARLEDLAKKFSLWGSIHGLVTGIERAIEGLDTRLSMARDTAAAHARDHAHALAAEAEKRAAIERAWQESKSVELRRLEALRASNPKLHAEVLAAHSKGQS